MRLIAISFVAFALSATTLIGMFLYALHVPTKAAPLIERPSAMANAPKKDDWPQRWAATNMRAALE
jgi:hypothetical protein